MSENEDRLSQFPEVSLLLRYGSHLRDVSEWLSVVITCYHYSRLSIISDFKNKLYFRNGGHPRCSCTFKVGCHVLVSEKLKMIIRNNYQLMNNSLKKMISLDKSFSGTKNTHYPIQGLRPGGGGDNYQLRSAEIIC